MDIGAELTSLWHQVPALTLVMSRVSTLFFTAPLLGGAFVPARVKTLMSLVLSFIILPLAKPGMPDPIPTDLAFFLLIAQELAVGLCIGFALTLLFEGVRAGGELINRYAGFSAAENFDPDAGIGEGPVGDMMMIGMVMLFFATDMHHFMIAAVARSFAAIPVGAWTLTPAMLHLAAQGTAESMAAACVISFPVLAVVMLTTMAEGVLTKAVSQINIMFISFAIKIMLAMLVLWAGMPAVVGFMGTCLQASQELVTAALRAGVVH